MPFTPLAPEETRQRLAAIRRTRRVAYACILGPVAFVLAIVVLNRVTGGAMHVFVDGAPWTRVFWFGLLGVFFAGWLLLMGSASRRCPRCGNGFFVSRSYRRMQTRSSVAGVNVFAGRCLNCKLPLRSR